ncbi:MAG: malate dehydrogenase [Candidatus Muproteobacteria bacterium RIFCSPHIGHO2_12_FULL_60_33]|uniref:Malate dehydrogenase n=1 Tax=Candidatus Muproteobacteria bacterium RIFCSPLOWO2_01_FULL_60_18 TaxID=1817768 RepID=A0A1F6TX07_9PROT|nr:MAG: malate dehydrogenase [Candidatus Muproteobacteria bacterium RIFCSPLOWO2_01_FULL_60_18]OGI55285.1 MAG: malate dehydrogenase [Candidatus Muproteobacteria bacterium RIFCSPHIGHO2_02_FULL_60_13]OGI56695.1 MAG: malate dehydrogenase [Candidatus Muproteobacteria bacterium RIFCSPHIGHO2_12_FULL_60_33]OGI57927.1 MAG: malate dehydrogenase [Candidatus Muproteobacteria bacterium RIFCSPHIGHO2_01_FULL_61_200]
MQKITIVGVGRVGESTAHNLAKHETCREIMLIDIMEGVPQGTALDIQESAPIYDFDTKLTGSNELKDMAGSDMVVITAGVPRKPGMSRSDVLETNLAVLYGIVDEVVKHAPQAMLLTVTNPVDVLTYAAWKRTGWPRHRVFGMAGVLDSARMASFVAMETGFSVKDINAMVLGGHGDSMVPMTRFTTINGIPVEHFLSKEKIEKIIKRTREGGAEILNLRKTASAYDAPAAAIASMIDAISHNRRHILPAVAVLDGEYGLKDICMGVPCVFGEHGMEKVIELPLIAQEAAEFKRSAESVRADLAKLKN